MIAKAVQEKDTTLTKKVCRERLAEVFGERVTENKAFVNEEVGRILGLTTGIHHLLLICMIMVINGSIDGLTDGLMDALVDWLID